MLDVQDAEQYADHLDAAAVVTQQHNDSLVAQARLMAEPEQDGTESECCDCGGDLGQRQALFKCRCITCQEILEKKRGGYGLG